MHPSELNVKVNEYITARRDVLKAGLAVDDAIMDRAAANGWKDTVVWPRVMALGLQRRVFLWYPGASVQLFLPNDTEPRQATVDEMVADNTAVRIAYARSHFWGLRTAVKPEDGKRKTRSGNMY
jgi:hypothetical protein